MITTKNGLGGGSANASWNILSRMLLHSQNADERDDWGVPLIRTYSPERARMGTDTDNVYPPIGPVKGGSTRMPGDTTMLHSQNADERDDCGVPMERSQIANDRDNGGCHGSGHTRLREHEWVLTLTV